MTDKVMKSIKEVDLTGLKIPVVAVHISPGDYPGKNVARVFDITVPTNVVVIKETIGELMEDIRSNTNLTFMPRGAEDEESLVGVWL